MAAAPVLQYIDYPTARARDCRRDFRYTLSPLELCVGFRSGTYRGVCHGDSGSPFVYPNVSSGDRPRQIAMVSKGPANCPAKYHYRIYVSIPAIYDWIVDHIGCSLPGNDICAVHLYNSSCVRGFKYTMGMGMSKPGLQLAKCSN